MVPHVHFHLIPRAPTGPKSYSSKPSFAQQSWLSFGRGIRTELDDDDAAVLVRQIRLEIRREVERIKAEGVDLEELWSRNGVARVEGGGAHLDEGGSGGSRGAIREREKL